MSPEDIENTLGRKLSQIEMDNFEYYKDITYSMLEEMLCTPIKFGVETRKFEIRKGYKTAFIDIFSEITEIKVNEKVITEYTKKLNDNLNSNWFNSIVFAGKQGQKVIEVQAKWGFDELPTDLKVLFSKTFAKISDKYDARVANKRVEDFSISFRDIDSNEQFLNDNQSIINKYGQCAIGNIQHGHIRCI